MAKIYIVRHGQTDWNKKNLIQGSSDIELNEVGIRQALEVAKKIDLGKIDVCISSPLKRARKTAELIVDGKMEIINNYMVVERRFGKLEGEKADEDFLKRIWDYKLDDKEYEIESIKEILERARKFLYFIKEQYKDKTLLIVSHGAFMKALHFNIVGYDENTDFNSFFPDNGEIYEYELK